MRLEEVLIYTVTSKITDGNVDKQMAFQHRFFDYSDWPTVIQAMIS